MREFFVEFPLLKFLLAFFVGIHLCVWYMLVREKERERERERAIV